MRLSEAIRLGAMLKPQGFGQGFDGVATCAAGAAVDAVGMLPTEAYADCDLENAARAHGWKLQLFQNAPCPCGCHPHEQRHRTIPHLNDIHKWTREQIADWVETIERATEQPQAGRNAATEVSVTPAASAAQE